jgi:hypothetical protein
MRHFSQTLLTRNALSTLALAMIGIGLWRVSPSLALVAVGTIVYGTALLAAILTKGGGKE